MHCPHVTLRIELRLYLQDEYTSSLAQNMWIVSIVEIDVVFTENAKYLQQSSLHLIINSSKYNMTVFFEISF